MENQLRRLDANAPHNMLLQLEPSRLLVNSTSAYQLRLARTPDEIRSAQALRYAVFNVELKEGLEHSLNSGLDTDQFDAVCDHLLVEHSPTNEIVGTYRLQTGETARRNLGYYCAQEFDFSPFEPLRSELVELGRACVHQNHRNLAVLGMLWKGIASYAAERGARYLCGCSSINSQDSRIGASAYGELCRRYLAPAHLRTSPLPSFECPLDHVADDAPKIPKLLRAYLSIGAKICGPPALDRNFKTIDFLTLLDIQSLSPSAREKFLS